ncbi:hypothetical protein [Bradyrhizobium sp. SEMIA]|nr:hypothetical protein [Bradyrhizobium sp. SEMIA]
MSDIAKTITQLEALIAKNGSTPLLQFLLERAKSGELIKPKRMI